MTESEKPPSRAYHVGDSVRVTDSFENYKGETITEVTGETGIIDGPRTDDKLWLILFDGARGWFVPEDKLERVDHD